VDFQPWQEEVFSDFNVSRWMPRTLFEARHEAGAAEAVVPLGAAEQDRCCLPVDLALTFTPGGRMEPGRLAEALGRSLAHFPPAAGRFVRRAVQPEGCPERELRFCILCNNAGAAFRAMSADGKLPPTVGLLAPKLFDRALATEPTAAGGPGGPLLRTQLLDFEDGQLLTLSLARGLADVVGLGIFLQCWARLYRGEDAGGSPALDRVALELLQTWPQPRLESNFVSLHHPEPPEHEAVVRGSLVTSVLFGSEELLSMVESISQRCRKKLLIYDSETLSSAEVLFATVVESLRVPLVGCLTLDLRETYGFPTLFGHARALIDLELPREIIRIASALRKLPQIAESRDFWSWKATQPRHSLEGRLVLDSWLSGLDLHAMRFGDAAPVGVNLSTTFWQECVANPAACGSGHVLLLPHAEGILMQGLLPRQAAIRLSTGRSFSTWQP